MPSLDSERWFVQDYAVNRKAVLEGEENTSSGYTVYSVKIRQDIYLEFMHFPVYMLYFNKSYLSKQIGLPGSKYMPFSLYCAAS